MASELVCFNLGLAARRVQRYYERALAPYGLTAGQFLALSALWNEDGLKFKDLAERLAIEGPTLTGALDRLERAGYVERRDDPDDRRSLRVWVTPQGWTIHPNAQAAVRTLEAQLQAGFSAAEFGVFSRVLAALPSQIAAVAVVPASSPRPGGS